MYWLIENEEQLKGFYNSGYKEAFIEIIPFNDRIHPHKIVCHWCILGHY